MSAVLITGSSRGIGAAAARRVARAGWDVAIHCCRSRERAGLLSEELRAMGVSAPVVEGDVSDPAQAAAVVEEARRALGELDALVCCAGIALPQQLLTDTTDEQWRRVFAVDVDGVFYTIRAALPRLIHRKRGSIVTVSSLWGETGRSCEVAYSAAKGAVIAMTRALAKELGPSGITVNCVAPGVIDTEMNGHLSREDLAALAEETPLGRIGRPEDAAESIFFLASPQAGFVTGQVLQPNGGLVI